MQLPSKNSLGRIRKWGNNFNRMRTGLEPIKRMREIAMGGAIAENQLPQMSKTQIFFRK